MIKGFEIVNSNNSRDLLYKYHDKGALRGVYLGYEILDKNYTMALPGATEWTGAPQSGKTEFLLDLLLNTSNFYGWRHLLYVPDVGDKDEVLATLIHKLTGKTFDKRYKNHIQTDEIDKVIDWIYYHFIIIHKVDSRAKITPYQFWDLAVELNNEEREKGNGGIQTATIDSWKDMKRYVNYEGENISRDDLYLEDVLNYRNTMCEMHKMHFHTVIHPTRTETDKDGKRKPPTPYELKGGPTWFDMGKTQITVHRIDGTANEVDIMITKAKPKSVAEVGKVRMFFDIPKAKFYFMHNQERFYASKQKRNLIGVDFGSSEESDEVPF